jgi:hypothetical protein
MWRSNLGWKELWRGCERDYFPRIVFIEVARRMLECVCAAISERVHIARLGI